MCTADLVLELLKLLDEGQGGVDRGSTTEDTLGGSGDSTVLRVGSQRQKRGLTRLPNCVQCDPFGTALD